MPTRRTHTHALPRSIRTRLKLCGGTAARRADNVSAGSFTGGMRPIRASIEIPAPIADVWEALADISSHSEWMADAQSIEFMGDRRSGIGTRIRVRTRVGPLRSDDIMEFDGWEPPHLMTVRHVGAVDGRGEFRLSQAGAGTRFDWVERLRFPWFLGGPVGYFFARPVLRRLFAANLRRFAATFAGPG